MLQTHADVSIEVCGRLTARMRYPHAFAFLDGRPSPRSIADSERLVRLMAYDMVAIHGSRGVDPAGIYAACLRTLYLLSPKVEEEWSWAWGGMQFRAAPCPEEKFASPDAALEGCAPGKTHELHQWASRLEAANIPEFCMEDLENGEAYPPPDVAIRAAAVLAVVAAQDLCGPHRVAVWMENDAHECLLVEAWPEKTRQSAYSGK